MAKEKEDIDEGFKVGDYVRNKKNGFEGLISRLEWSGMVRSALIPTGKTDRGWFIISLKDIELILNKEKESASVEKIDNEAIECKIKE